MSTVFVSHVGFTVRHKVFPLLSSLDFAKYSLIVVVVLFIIVTCVYIVHISKNKCT